VGSLAPSAGGATPIDGRLSPLPHRPPRSRAAGEAPTEPAGHRRKPEIDLHDVIGELPLALSDLAAPAYVADRDGRLRWLNNAYIELLGDRHGQSFLDVVAPEDRHLARTYFARKVVSKVSTIFDVRVVVRSGAQLRLRVSSVPLRRAGEVVGVFGIGIPLEPAPPARANQETAPALTPRQLEVLRLLSEGRETHEIATRLGIAEETARNHIRALLRAIGAHSRLEAVAIGLRLGMLVPHVPGSRPSSAGDGE
jgi:PAS domain S-box-containing protein